MLDDERRDPPKIDHAARVLVSWPRANVPKDVSTLTREVVETYRGLTPSEKVAKGTLAALAVGLLERWLALEAVWHLARVTNACGNTYHGVRTNVCVRTTGHPGHHWNEDGTAVWIEGT